MPKNKNQNKTPLKILLPKVDVIFKLLFGDSRNMEILIDFLKSVLSLEEDEYEAITIVDPHLKREKIGDKLGIVDVRLKAKNGKSIHIELQVLELQEMPERMTYYNSKMLVTQLKGGESYNTLQKTISILISDFEIINSSKKYHHIFQLHDKSTGIKFTDIIEINTLELKKIPTETDNTKKYEWLQFLKSEKEEEFLMIAEKNPIIKKAYVELKRLSQDEKNQILYEDRQKAIRDEDARTRFALNKGRSEGIIEGRSEGIIEGKLETAKNLLGINLPIEQIAQVTGLSIEDIKKLENNIV